MKNQVIGHIQKNSILKKTTESVKKYSKQNFCSRLYKKERKNYFDTLDVNKIIDNTPSSKNIQLLPSKKIKPESKITLENSEENITSLDNEVSEEPNKFFKKQQKL